jgi:hypothetical protein
MRVCRAYRPWRIIFKWLKPGGWQLALQIRGFLRLWNFKIHSKSRTAGLITIAFTLAKRTFTDIPRADVVFVGNEFTSF